MKIAIQCADKKQANAGSFKSREGKHIMFVADPSLAPPSRETIYAHPDDISDDGRSWRERLLEYNKMHAQTNPLGLLPAYQLYTNPAYEALVHKFGIQNIYILSAGWGLIRAGFLTPVYNITFTSIKNKKHIKRYKRQEFSDFNMLTDDGEDVVYIGGKSYQPMFCRLLQNYACRKLVVYNSINKLGLPHGFEAVLYKTNTRTNWHYEIAKNLIDEAVKF